MIQKRLWKWMSFAGVFGVLASTPGVAENAEVPGRFLAVARESSEKAILDWADRFGLDSKKVRGSKSLWVIQNATSWSADQIRRNGLFKEVSADTWLDESEAHVQRLNEDALTLWPFASLMSGSRPNDVPVGSNWALERIHAPQAWTKRTDTGSEIIAILDSGVEITHPDLADNIWINEDEIPANGVDDDHNGWVDDVHGYDAHFEKVGVEDSVGHGTNLAGIIGSVGNNGIGTAGVAWKTRMMVIRGDDARRMSWTGAVKGAYYARDNGSRVINASWGSYSATTGIREMLKDMEESGVMVINAVGNNSNNVDTEQRAYPAGFATSNLIVVNALHPNGSLVHYSDYGPKYVHLAAPGWGNPTTFLGGKYGGQAGCSVATPYVTAAVAMVWAEHPDWTHHQVKEQILSTVDVLPSLHGKVKTSGVLNLARALGVEE